MAQGCIGKLRWHLGSGSCRTESVRARSAGVLARCPVISGSTPQQVLLARVQKGLRVFGKVPGAHGAGGRHGPLPLPAVLRATTPLLLLQVQREEPGQGGSGSDKPRRVSLLRD